MCATNAICHCNHKLEEKVAWSFCQGVEIMWLHKRELLKTNSIIFWDPQLMSFHWDLPIFLPAFPLTFRCLMSLASSFASCLTFSYSLLFITCIALPFAFPLSTASPLAYCSSFPLPIPLIFALPAHVVQVLTGCNILSMLLLDAHYKVCNFSHDTHTPICILINQKIFYGLETFNWKCYCKVSMITTASRVEKLWWMHWEC